MNISKKAIITLSSILAVIVIIFVALFSWKIYAENNSDNANVRDYAQLNPLIRPVDYYVQVNDPVKKNKKNEVGKYTYKIDGYNDKGEKQTITFDGLKKLKKGAYLKISLILDNPKGYNKVKKDDIPDKAMKKLD